jgi:hypothetical protein
MTPIDRFQDGLDVTNPDVTTQEEIDAYRAEYLGTNKPSTSGRTRGLLDSSTSRTTSPGPVTRCAAPSGARSVVAEELLHRLDHAEPELRPPVLTRIPHVDGRSIGKRAGFPIPPQRSSSSGAKSAEPAVPSCP